MIAVEVPDGYRAEREYVLEFVLKETLGIPYTLTYGAADENTRVVLSNQTALTIDDILFQTPQSKWLTEAVIPNTPVPYANINSNLERDCTTGPRLPVLFPGGSVDHNNPRLWSQAGENSIHVHFDVFGAIFFMLSRYEEVVSSATDLHRRFDGNASIAVKNGFEDRPIVDEYVSLLAMLLNRLNSQLMINTLQYSLTVSHDLDRPFRFTGLGGFVKGLAGHLIKRKDTRMAFKWVTQGLMRLRGPEHDPFLLGLKQLFQISEKYGHKNQVNVMGAMPGNHDDGYDVAQEPLRSTLQSALNRGHVVGFHPGYGTCLDSKRFIEEKGRVENAFAVSITSGRQHYLKMQVPETWRIWEKQGIINDGSVGYPDRNGFRAGTCRRFKLFDVEASRVLDVWETPLIVMDGALKASFNEGLTPDEAIEKALQLARICKQYGGTFSILWHNSSLHGDWSGWGRAYEAIIKDATALIDA